MTSTSPVTSSPEPYDTAYAPMRDGTVLRADVYRPPYGRGPWPVLLARCPYGRRDPGILARLAPATAARRCWLVVLQDTRGRFGSDGAWEPLAHEYDDGHDTVRWAAGLPGSDGRVAMYGPSYLGHAQWAAIEAAPPELVAAIPEFTWSDPADGLLARGGARELGLPVQWTLGLGHEVLRRRHAADAVRRRAALAELARAEGELRAGHWDLAAPDALGLPVPGRVGAPPPRAVPADHTALPPVATLTVAGWYDAFLQGSLDNHAAARAAGHRAALIIGPWTHDNQSGRAEPAAAGDVFDFGPHADSAHIDGGGSLLERQLDWLETVVERTRIVGGGSRDAAEPRNAPEPGAGRARGTSADATALVFVTGAGRWRRFAAWPPPSDPTAWYLHANGELSTRPPSVTGMAGPGRSFRHDPADPVPALGGALLLTEQHPAGPADQRPIEARPDVLVYASAPLTRPLEIAGRISAVLTVTCTAPTATWVVRLCDVAPDGTSVNLADGIARAAHPVGRPGPAGPAGSAGPAGPAGPIETAVDVDLWSAHHLFRPGHALRVHVAATSHPRWQPEPGPAVQTVLPGASRLMLPSVPACPPRTRMS
ncbi:CocE/NonD family hydrolase [Streptomyces sp. NPDC088194]|uniref:CocE/NonD family hydrolase n=1 Tax=Streptomyces sp. NPDC088194 TaxID=3154931 RepID=UPI00344FA8A5